jgi:glucose-1-phosphate thymidylyltransferase
MTTTMSRQLTGQGTPYYPEITGLVLAGGRGTRLYPLTAVTNKNLLTVGRQPLILYAIGQLLEAGVRDILVLIDHLHADQFMRVLQDGSQLGLASLAYIWQPEHDKGLPAAIKQAEPFIQTEKLVVVCGDVIAEDGINDAVTDFVKQSSGARIVATRASDTAGYSLLDTAKSQVTRIHSKDKNRHVPGLIDLGFYMYHADVFSKIRRLRQLTEGRLEIWDLNEQYIQQSQLAVSLIEGWWSDVGGSLEHYLAAHKRYE